MTKKRPIRPLRWVVPALLAAALNTGVPAAQDVRPGPRILTAAQWQEDLDVLAKTVAEKHRHAFDMVSRADFEKAAAELRAGIPALADHEVVVGMIKLVAMIRDGHSRLTMPTPPGVDTQSHTATNDPLAGLAFHALPVQFYLFSDGLHVQAAVPEFRALVGAKVVRIGRLTVEAAMEAVRPTVAYDSAMWVRHVAPQYLRIPEVLQACGVTDSLQRVPLEVEIEGVIQRFVLEPLPPGQEPKQVTWSDVTGAAKPLFLQNPGKTFWFEYLPDHKSLYIQVNAIQDDPGETLAAFIARATTEARARGAEKIILDLRRNGGGNNYLNRGPVLSLLQLEGLNRYGRMFTIIGRATFSAALSLVSALERWSETIFVGEPTGNTPSQYGDARRYPLPHSGLTVRLSSVYWRDSDVNERRPWVAPDLAVETSWADFSVGRDPVLEAALDYRAPDNLFGQLKEKYRWGGINAAAAHYFKYRNSPATAAERTEETLLAMAEFLIAENKLADATGILRRAVAEYPESFACQLGLGKRLVEQGAGESALEPLKKALALKPGDADAAAWLRKAESLAAAKK